LAPAFSLPLANLWVLPGKDGKPRGASPRRRNFCGEIVEIGFGATEKDLRLVAVSPFAVRCRRQDLNLHCQ
jgi:hypothetical protein